MWHNNQTINLTYTSHHSQNAYAHVGSMGWRKIKTGAADGVTNLFAILSAAKANGRRADVYIVSNQIERAVLR